MGVAQPAGVQGDSGPRVDRGVPSLLDGEPVRSAPQLAPHQVRAPLGGVQLGERKGSLEPQRERTRRGGPRGAPGGAVPRRSARRARWPPRRAPPPRPRPRCRGPARLRGRTAPGAVRPGFATDEQLGLQAAAATPGRPRRPPSLGRTVARRARRTGGRQRARAAAGRAAPARGRPRRRRGRCRRPAPPPHPPRGSRVPGRRGRPRRGRGPGRGCPRGAAVRRRCSRACVHQGQCAGQVAEQHLEPTAVVDRGDGEVR